MALLKIRVYGSPVLRERAQPVERVDEALRDLIASMGETMYRAGGVGLAANQVGETRRFFVVDVDQVSGEESDVSDDRRKKNPSRRLLRVFINPEILERSIEDCPYKEGCLSLPGLEGRVFRPERIKARYTSLDGETKELEATGLLARVFQHELDHLDGVMFIDHLTTDQRRTLAGKLSKLRKMSEEHPEGIEAEVCKSLL